MWSLGLCRNILHSPVLLCGHLVCAGIFLHSPVFTQACARNMLAESELFDLCACSCMSYQVGYLKPDLCKS